MREFATALEILERRLRYRHRFGGDRLPTTLARRIWELSELLARETAGQDPEGALREVAEALQGCTRCGLHQFRKNIVVGEGDPKARLLFIGEGPGEEEDLQGRPFVGPAGQLLTRIITAMGLRRAEVFICNMVKCRPPANRAPTPEEIAVCRPFLVRQLRAISPKAICTLGTVATLGLIQRQGKISSLRGRMHQWEGIPVMPTFHPSHLLRHPENKRAVWEDMKQVMDHLQQGS